MRRPEQVPGGQSEPKWQRMRYPMYCERYA